MKHKYQINLSRRLVASSFAAVFSAGAFSSQVGATEEVNYIPDFLDNNEQQVPETVLLRGRIIPKEGVEASACAKVKIDNEVHEFQNIPSDQISSNFNKYIEGDLKKAVGEGKKNKIILDMFKILINLDNFYGAGYLKKFNFESFLDSVVFLMKTRYVLNLVLFIMEDIVMNLLMSPRNQLIFCILSQKII